MSTHNPTAMPPTGARATRNDKDPLWRRTTLDSSFTFFRRDHSTSDRQRHSSDVSAPDSGGTTSSHDGLQPELNIHARRMSAFTDIRPTPPASPEPPPSPPIQASTPHTKRFSLLRFRHASDPQLSTRAKEQAAQQRLPPLPASPDGPHIITTAPTIMDNLSPQKKRLRFQAFSRGKPQAVVEVDPNTKLSLEKSRIVGKRSTPFGSLRSRISFADDYGSQDGQSTPASNGEGSRMSLALPFRKSESNRFDREPRGENESRPSLSYSKSSRGWLSRRGNRNRQSLFPLPAHLQPSASANNVFGASNPSQSSSIPETFSHTLPATPRASTSALSVEFFPDVPSGVHTPHSSASPARNPVNESRTDTSAPSPAHASALVGSSISFAGPAGVLFRTQSSASTRSTPDLLPPRFKMFRNRSSTMNSTGDRSDDGAPPTPPVGSVSGRNSTSTTGRSSFGNLLGLPRFRGSSEQTPRHGSPALGSLYNLAPELTLPAREDGETPLNFLARLEDLVEKRHIARLLSKTGDDFSLAVLRSHMRKFAFFGDPLDMAIRKLLMFVELPLETQQIDRVLNGFADRYSECNPGIFVSQEQAYFMTFSILMLHTDIFNKNNKRKMTKADYVKIATEKDIEDSVAPDILACFYDNIVYTTFIRVEDDMDRKSTRSRGKRKKKAIQKAVPEPVKAREPIDPYTLILESKLDNLRPPIKDVLLLDDPYSYVGAHSGGSKRLRRPPKYGIIQITSERSRPDAWKNESTIENPDEARAGVVDLPVHKIGILRRKNPKKKTARKPWEEWGAILTDSELRFTRDTHQIGKYVKQYQKHVDEGHGDSPLVFEPPLDRLPSAAQFPVSKCVALVDTSYRKHKNAFVMFPDPQNDRGIFEETFLAESEADLNDWLSRINYQAAYKTAGIMPRGIIGGHYEGQRHRGLRRLDSNNGTSPLDQTFQTPTGEVTIRRGGIDRQLAEQMGQARRETMSQRIVDAEDKISAAIKRLDTESRNARHLMILAPIQPKTRNEVVQAAGRISQKLKFSRVDVWRMKSYRDILAMDLDEERRRSLGPGQILRPEFFTSPSAQQDTTTPGSASGVTRPSTRSNQLDRLNSKRSTAGSAPSITPSSGPSAVPAKTSDSESSETETENDYDFHTPPELSELPKQPGPKRSSLDDISPPSIRTTSSEHAGSMTSQITTAIARDQQDQTITQGELTTSPTSMETHTIIASNMTPAETSSLDGGLNVVRPETPTDPDTSIAVASTSPHGKSKGRRSLHRTLRTGPLESPLGHHKSRKTKDSVSTMSTVDIGDGGETEQLPRAVGSFNLHGKKASVITFGDEWANISPGDRLQTRRAATSQASLTAPSDGEAASISEGRAPRSRTGSQSTTATGAQSLTSKPSRTMSVQDESLRVPSGPIPRERRGTNSSHTTLPLPGSRATTPIPGQGRRESNFSQTSDQSGLERVASPPIRAS